MIEITVGILLLVSAVIVLVASIGIIRFNDIYARMHVVTKVSSFGLILLLMAVNLYFQKIGVFIQSIIIFHIIIFLSPVSAHVISKISRLLNNEENVNSVLPNDESKKEQPL